MRLFIDIDSGEFLQSPDRSRSLGKISLKRRDSDSLLVQFVSSGAITDLGTGASGILGIKQQGAYGSGYIASSTAWTKQGTGTNTSYNFPLNLNTAEIDAIFSSGNEPNGILAMVEVQWTVGSIIKSSVTLPANIYNDVIRGDEGVLAQANPVYPVPADILTKSGNLSGVSDPASARINLSVYSQAETNAVITAHSNRTDNPHSTTKAQVGLGNVDNTADSAKPVSTTQQTALNLKANLASPTFTGTVSGITAAMVGLDQVNNTADSAKPVSTPQAAALSLKANLASPTFTGTVGGLTTRIQSSSNSSVTAVVGARYTIHQPSSTATFTDPTSLNLGDSYEVSVVMGAAVIGGTSYTASGQRIVRYHMGGNAWVTLVLTKTDVGLGNVPNTDATSRANHTGTQTASTISDFAAAAVSATASRSIAFAIAL